MIQAQKTRNRTLASALVGVAAVASGCTSLPPGAFRLAQQEQVFDSQLNINTKIDLLWVVDNSASMNVTQDKLRKGFASFANRYMKPTWDIRVAVITTDTYIAHPQFQNFLNQQVSARYRSNYINGLANWTRPTQWNPDLVDPTTRYFEFGVKQKDLSPAWGTNYAKLLPGYHDGPIVSLCYESNGYFYLAASECRKRDNPDYVASNGRVHYHRGVANCLNPDTANGEDSLTQCVNTLQNDTVHSGKAILSTQDGSSTQDLIDGFIVNASVGASGLGSERGIGSVIQLLADNESSPTAFFRKGSLRGIIFVSDEEDQTMTIPSTGNPGPYDQYTSPCAAKALKKTEYAPTCDPATQSCPASDYYTYTISSCPIASKLIPVSTLKGQIDSFFKTLDGTDKPNYFVAAIVPLTGDSVAKLAAARALDDAKLGGGGQVSTDRGDRYIELADSVGNGSMKLDLGQDDYSPILDAIGKTLVESKHSFTLERAPTGTEDMVVKVIHADGTYTEIPPSKYVVEGKTLTITDQDTVLSLASTDSISINYQPKTVRQ